VSVGDKKSFEEIVDNGTTIITRYPSQIVTYNSKYVSKLSDVSNDLNVSGSLSIRYGEISGGGSGSYVNTETFNQSDINFLITVKVINQTINVKDQLQFWALGGKAASSYTSKEFTDVYGDSFISGFQEGGQFSAIVSIKARDSSNLTEIKANAHLALQVGVGSVDANADFKMEKKALNKDSEINITVNWSGGGQLKESEKPWTIETLQEVAAKFPDLVANCPQRTHAILTKFTALRGYLQWRATNTLEPLDYEVANLYTSELLDVYMGYKTIWKQIHEMLDDLDSEGAHQLVKAPTPSTTVTMPKVKSKDENWVDGPVLTPYEPTFVGLDLALRHARSLMVRIAAENDAITKDPSLAVDQTRPIAYLRPQVFKQLLPLHSETSSLLVGLVHGKIQYGGEGEGEVAGYSKQTVLPGIVLSFNRIDLDRSSPRQIARLYTFSQTADKHKYTFLTRSVDGTASTKTYTTGTESLMVPVNDEGIQSGTFNMPVRTPPAPAGTADHFIFRQRVNFKYPYEDKAPAVVGFLTGFDIEVGGPQFVSVDTNKIDKTGFDVVITSVRSLRAADVSWFACPADAPNVFVGSSGTPWTSLPFADALQLPKKAEGFSGHVQLAPRKFTKPPRIFSGLQGFANNLDGINNRVNSVVLDVTKKGFNWKVDGWDTALVGGAISYVVWQD
jgi:hypothetical protein